MGVDHLRRVHPVHYHSGHGLAAHLRVHYRFKGGVVPFVDEHDCVVSPEHDIGTTWQTAVLKSEAEAETVQRTSDPDLAGGVRPPDPGHDRRSLRRAEDVHCRSHS